METGKLIKQMKEGFGKINEQFDNVDRQFEKVDCRFDKIEDKIESEVGSLAKMVSESFTEMGTDLSEIKENVRIIKVKDIGHHGRRFERLEDDVRKLKTKVGIVDTLTAKA